MQAISSLAEAAYDSVEIPEDAVDDQPQTYCLSQLYSALMSKVLEVTQRYIIATHHNQGDGLSLLL